ncbi:helix-turn-helix transcriptional regulator [Ralstonia holmesii]|uniref:helix-turn-helix transcriptional regulator n=1 Tax=Ralstonia TaxID=48736 RepID=UPI0004689190|nr:helix-turn-helix domain-containing protein [Ralstonia pickettii]
MSQGEFLTPDQLVERWAGAVSKGTLANWRQQKRGPAYMKLGAKVRYPPAQVEAWEAANTKLGEAN